MPQRVAIFGALGPYGWTAAIRFFIVGALEGCRGGSSAAAPAVFDGPWATDEDGALRDLKAVAAGYNHTCALTREGDVLCWGKKLGVLETDPTRCKSAPARVPGMSHATAIAAGWDFTCARTQDGTAWCWGENTFGQLGDGRTPMVFDAAARSPNPVRVVGLKDVTDITAGAEFACAILAEGAVSCWGRNDGGALGNGSMTRLSSTPVVVDGVNHARSVRAAGDFACALLADGSVTCWGDRTFGVVHEGSATFSTTPVPVDGLRDVRDLSAGPGLISALLDDSTVQSWGTGAEGRLGHGEPRQVPSARPLNMGLVSLLSEVRAVAAGGNFACALLKNTTVQCWGSDASGQLGRSPGEVEHCRGSFPCSWTPLQVPGLDGVVALSAGPAHTCAVLGSGSALCWGDDSYGQLGHTCHGFIRPTEGPPACGHEVSFCASPVTTLLRPFDR